MKPNARSVLTALRKVEGLAVRVVATGHGPVLARNVAELTGRYAAWSSSALAKATSSALLLYCADYGYADRLGQSLARGLTKTGAEVVMLDAGSADEQEVADALGRAGAVVLLAPPSPDPAAPAGAAATGGGVAGAAPAAARRASRALAALFAGVKPGTRVLLAESYGGRDEPVDTLRAALLAAGADVAARPLRVTDVPGEAVYQAYEEAGTDLGQALGAKDARRAQKEGMAPAVAKALGRLSGGLYLVTAARGGAQARTGRLGVEGRGVLRAERVGREQRRACVAHAAPRLTPRPSPYLPPFSSPVPPRLVRHGGLLGGAGWLRAALADRGCGQGPRHRAAAAGGRRVRAQLPAGGARNGARDEALPAALPPRRGPLRGRRLGPGPGLRQPRAGARRRLRRVRRHGPHGGGRPLGGACDRQGWRRAAARRQNRRAQAQDRQLLLTSRRARGGAHAVAAALLRDLMTGCRA